MKTYALLDSDIIAFQQSLKCQQTIEGFGDEPIVELIQDEEFLYKNIEWFIRSILKETEADVPIVCLSDPDHNFRYDLLPTYKGNRAGTSKPLLHEAGRKYLEDNYKCYLKENLEADDVMGILSTHGDLLQGKRIICTVDKDLYQIPGYMYNWNKPKRGVEEITHEVGEMFHMVQTLTGDVCDGYEGVLGIGEKKAYTALLEGLEDGYTLWETVVHVYEKNGCAEEDALCIARVARMCTRNDYDFKNKEVILWNPTNMIQ